MKYLKGLFWLLLGSIIFLGISTLHPVISDAQNGTPKDQSATLVEADKLYLLGERNAADKLYRQAKPAFPQEKNRKNNAPQPITDPEQLSGAGTVYWRNVKEGMEQGLENKVQVSLKLLLESSPEFLPAYPIYAEAAKKFEWKDDVIAPLEKAVSLFPDSIDLTKALVLAHESKEQWLEASIAARQFTIVYDKHPEAPEFAKIADRNFGKFKSQLNTEIIGQSIVGVVIGAFTGNLNQSISLAPLMLKGESGMGEQLASAYRQKLPLITEPAVVEYITKMGNDLAGLMGRKDFKYEYYVVKDNAINAFALPGGKVFVNTGAIMAANSEAELAGLMGHEIAHAVLSHGFQRITKAYLLDNVKQLIPFGNLVSTLVTSDYSRQNETQSDIIATRVLATAGYAADGLRNLFVSMKQQEKSSSPSYLSSHPATDTRIRYLEDLIQTNGYNRYSFEGIERHTKIKNLLKSL